MSDIKWAAGVAFNALMQVVPQEQRPAGIGGMTAALKAARKFLQMEYPQKAPFALESIFNTLGQQTPQKHVWVLASQHLDQKTLFPTPALLSQVASTAAQTNLWKEFKSQFDTYTSFAGTDAESQLELALGLLARYAWAMPSRLSADISLYDESRVAAALAACLSIHSDTEIDALTKSSAVATFLEGDISGIQRFIYTIPSGGAAKQLRARSLYLQLLTDTVARYVLRQSGMPITNLIYAGGGHFYLLLPPIDEAGLKALQNEIDEQLLKHHDGELNIALGQVALTGEDFAPDKFGEQWTHLKQATGRAKRRRYAKLGPERLAAVFDRRPMEKEIGNRYQDRNTPLGEDDKIVSSLGTSFIDLGRYLTRASNLALELIPPEPDLKAGRYDAVLAAFGVRVHLLNEEGTPLGDTKAPTERVILLGMRGYPGKKVLDALRTREWQMPIAPRVRYIVNEVAGKNANDVADFSELARASQGIDRLGVLRMDVDNLGKLFGDGFKNSKGERNASLTRIAGLSSALSLFFEGWVGELCRQFNEDKTYQAPIIDDMDRKATVEAIYAVYSGGDDLFIVGRWDVLLLLAQKIRKDLGDFAGGNPSVHISAGLTLHVAKYPLYQAAEEAEEALDAAKEDQDSESGLKKDALSFLGLTVRWADWPAVIDLKKEIVTLSQNKQVGRALIQTLLQFYTQYMDTQREAAEAQKSKKASQSLPKQVTWGPWLWRILYQLKRLEDRAKLKEGELKLIRDTIQSTLSGTTAQKAITRIGIAARWADIQTRNAKEE